MRTNRFLGVAVLFWLAMTANAQQWTPKQAPLMTKFAKDVDPENVLPEYPRPQMVRKEWKNLNGLWQFQPGTWEREPYPKGKLSRNILVPFAVESALSGVQETTHERLWYRREFTVPKDWDGQRILMHFGAVDYEAVVFINDRPVGKHEGGYDPFSFDITDHLKEGTQTVTVKVWDPTTREGFPRGKQALNQIDIMYTPVTGIWQTVWLEPVAKDRIVDFEMVPDIDNSQLNLSVETSGGRFLTYTAEVRDGDKVIATVDSKPMKPTAISIKNQKLWSPDSPFLYDMTITLKDGDKVVDVVDTYFGMRKISVEQEGEFQKLYLNNEFVFQMGPLDQGYWPDGLYTAPTDEALRYDLEVTKELGFNMTRKHIKVEPKRWYYWADKLGLLVWQDMPSSSSYTHAAPEPNKEAFTRELMRMVDNLKNVPSIVMWVIFNESQGQHDTEHYSALVKGLDPSRVVNEASGGTNHGAADVADVHSYPQPAYAQSPYQVTVCGEYGGIGYQMDEHIWNPDDLKEYITINTEAEYLSMYDDFADMLVQFKTNQGLSAAVYTEITDVEIELNGIMTYDRVLKVEPEKIARINKKIIEKTDHVYSLVPTAKEQNIDWQYTFEKPANNWTETDFLASSWKTGRAGFGSKGTPGAINGTTWESDGIWLRRTFELGDLSKIDLDDIRLSIHHDDECVVYINGVKAAELDGFTSNYVNNPISDEAKKALVSNGTNTIAIHCKQNIGGQYIDAGLSIATGNKAIAEKTLESLK
ncbi:hypothetical protein KZP23_22485 [Echinicola marina]|uniref:glycoside hydrolase family 2 protein n=1 Tax=Echinicola marina TaxID=2859768 RepID=UPI001CF70955|nr:sugar-binding domain-containing protein [Echinicola marina]UCS93375.1 hypothetical protein KZP23_22485 [Echinicola marina]